MRGKSDCNESFLAKGHNAYSCGVQKTSGDLPRRHLRMDVIEALYVKKWDLIVLHPPCTYLAVSGNRWYGKNADYTKRLSAVKWTQQLWDMATSVCRKVCLENPVGVLNSLGTFPKPQYIQPWQFGHGEVKKTGLWLYNLPNLLPTNIVGGREARVWKMPPSANRA